MENCEIFYVGQLFAAYDDIDIKLDEYLSKTGYQFVVKTSNKLKDVYGKSQMEPRNKKLIYQYIQYKCGNSNHNLGGNYTGKCQACVKFSMTVDTSGLEVIEFNNDHNHQPSEICKKRRRKRLVKRHLVDTLAIDEDQVAERPSTSGNTAQVAETPSTSGNTAQVAETPSTSGNTAQVAETPSTSGNILKRFKAMEEDMFSVNVTEKEELIKYFEAVVTRLKENHTETVEPEELSGFPGEARETNIIKFDDLSKDHQFELVLEWLELSQLKDQIFENKYKIKSVDLQHLKLKNVCDQLTSVNLCNYGEHFETDSLKLLINLIKKKSRFNSTFICAQCFEKLSSRAIACDACLKWFDMLCVQVINAPQGSWFCENCINPKKN